MSAWKLQCYFCSDTVSTFKLNKTYYLLHLVAVHNVQQHADSMLEWLLTQQGVVEQRKIQTELRGITDSRIVELASSSRRMSAGQRVPSARMLAPVLNIKGLTIERVQDGSTSLALKQRQQHMAVSQWANGCVHGCRSCIKLGKTFSSSTRQGLLKHLQVEHEMSGRRKRNSSLFIFRHLSEEDYKEKFQLRTLVSRVGTMLCKECGGRVKRQPRSLAAHMRKHGMDLASYWMKHIRPKNLPYNPNLRAAASTRRQPRPLVQPRAGLDKRTASEKRRSAAQAVDQMKILDEEDNEVNPMDMLEVEIIDICSIEEDKFKEHHDAADELDNGIKVSDNVFNDKDSAVRMNISVVKVGASAVQLG